jgi:YggT family protein
MAHIFVLKAISICITIYSWFKPSVDGKLWNTMCLLTGPYLALFKGIKSLRKGAVDYTPLVAVSVLVFCNQILESIIYHFEHVNKFSIFILFGYVLSAIWNIASYIIIFFGILCLIRLITMVFHVKANKSYLNVIDLAVQPVISAVMKIIQRKLAYEQLLFVTLLSLAAILLLGTFLFRFLSALLLNMPA